MRALNRLRAIFVVISKRIISQPWLVIATILGLVISIALMMSIPLYADAVYYRIFLKNVANGATMSQVPPLPFIFRYDGSIYGTVDWEQIEPVDTYMSTQAAQSLGLPLLSMARYFSTDPFGIYADAESAFDNLVAPLTWSGFAFISGFEDHVDILEGNFPAPAGPAADGDAVEVMLSEDLAVELGLQIGETYIAYTQVTGEEVGLVSDIQIPVRIAGIWRASDPDDTFWFFSPTAFEERMIVSEETFTGRVSDELIGEVYTAVWYLLMDGSDLHHTQATGLIRRSISVTQRAAGILPNTKLAKSPVDALYDYQRSANLLTILLYAFSIPILGLLLAFITLTSQLGVERRRNEIAVLRSRGAMSAQMLGIAAIESLLLGLIALSFSSPTGMLIARLIGQAKSFLNFGSELETLRVDITMATLRFGLFGVALVIAAQVIPTISASAHTIVSYKREQARMLRKPWWQRSGLDFLLLIPAGYGAYILREQGSVVLLEEQFGSSLLQNPLLFLVPALAIFALTLFFLRLMPVIMSAISWVAGRTRAIGLLMASRHLARTPSFYTTPLILLVLTLSLSAFTASLAHTLDAHLYERTYYEAGADIQFLDLGEGAQQPGLGFSFEGGSGDPEAATEEDTGPRWLFLPVSEYLNSPGVRAVTRVGRYPAVTRLSSGTQTGVFFGVDRAALPEIAFWREDFSSDSLGALMNALAVSRNGVLVPREFMKAHAFNVGDSVRVDVVTYGQTNKLDLKIVGAFDLFPTWYPSEGPLFVGDLDYLFEQAGGQFPYSVWLKTQHGVDFEEVVEEDLDVQPFIDWTAPMLTIAEEQQLPERQGLFGLLSVGFAAAAVLTVLGFLLYALFSFRRRFIEFGVLRAVGLSSSQMTSFLGWELAFLILMGGGLGTALGALVSSFFIPYLQIGVDEASRIPPYVVDIAWAEIFRIYGLFVILFVVALVALVVMLRRMRIFEAVKLGETA